MELKIRLYYRLEILKNGHAIAAVDILNPNSFEILISRRQA